MKILRLILFVGIFLYGCSSSFIPQNNSTSDVNQIVTLQRLSSMKPDMPDPGSLGAYPNLSQTIEGITVGLDWVFSDDNRVYIGYHYQGVAGQRYFDKVQLFDDGGRKVKLNHGFGMSSGRSDLLKLELPSGYGAGYHEYALPETLEVGEMIDLQFTLELEPINLPEAGLDLAAWFRNLFVGASQEDQRKLERLEPLQKNWEGIVGPFIFPFSVAVK